MSPLAQRITNDSTLRMRDRQFQRNGSRTDVPAQLRSAICFEMSAVAEAVAPLGLKMMRLENGKIVGMLDVGGRFAFLPAPITWIEFAPPGNTHRIGYLLESAGDMALVTLCYGRSDIVAVLAETAIPLKDHEDWGQLRYTVPKIEGCTRDAVSYLVWDTYPLLAMINTPRVIGRRTHMPHAGLQRKLANSLGTVGKYPLHAWHEIELRVTVPPKYLEGEHETHLTGQKALHFCRAHLRIRLGQLEYVSSSWRGNPALGIKQSRYLVRH